MISGTVHIICLHSKVSVQLLFLFVGNSHALLIQGELNQLKSGGTPSPLELAFRV